MGMKPITTSVYTFSDLIEGNYLYIDKTSNLLPFLLESKGQYFLARPRRFGKSLLISTLECIFRGRRDLFKGLAIEASDYNWKTYPVIRLDMGSTQAESPETLSYKIKLLVQEVAEQYSISLPQYSELADPSVLFKRLISDLAQTSSHGKVVVLIDEYDKPLLNHIGKPDAIKFRDILKNFYSVVKTTEGLQRFAFITGVSKFSRVSIFSDLNNLTDLTMDARAATLLGYTQDELIHYFSDRLPALSQAIQKTESETLEQLKLWYDGFRFDENAPTVFNPVSIGKCFASNRFENFWFETATPTFLLDLLKKNPIDIGKLTVSKEAFSVYEVENPSVLPLLVQTGYLTIQSSYQDGDERIYNLDFPNQEIRISFSKSIATSFSSADTPRDALLTAIVTALRAGDCAEVLENLSAFFANIPYDITLKNEKYYQTLFYAILMVLGARVRTEVTTNRGRIDATVETANYIYVFEFKLHDTAESAMAQIHERKYYEKFTTSGKTIFLVGVAFDATTRNIGPYLVETR